MALRTLQLCIVFTIGLSVNYSTLVTTGAVISPGTAYGWPSVIAPSLTIRIHQPEHAEVIGVRGKSVVLRCPITKQHIKNNVTYTWLHDDVPIDFRNESRRQIDEQNGTLEIRRVVGKKSASLEGQYRCVATNHIGTVVTEAITLRIATFSRQFTAEPTDMTVDEGGNVAIPCFLTSVPEPTIHWLRNKTRINYTHRYVQLQSGSLLIKNIQPSDAGSFQCEVENRLQKKPRTSNAGNLIIQSGKTSFGLPQFIPLYTPRIIKTKLGGNVTLHCVANGVPTPFVSWGYNKTNNTIPVSNSSVLRLHNITSKEAGIYICSARNRFGNVSQVWTVQMAPHFNETPVSIEIPPPQVLRFNCSALGYPTPVIRWLKNGIPLHIDNQRIITKGRILIVTDTRRNDSGFYECIAENAAGEVRTNVQVTVIEKEHHLVPPINLNCRPVAKDQVCLTWDAPTLPENLMIISYTVHYFHKFEEKGVPMQLTEKNNAVINALKPNTSYTFHVRIYNKLGASDPSAPIICAGASVGKRKTNVTVESPTSARVTWTHLIDDAPCGNETLYKVQSRRRGHPSNVVYLVHGNIHEYFIKDLIPNQDYELRILTGAKSADENVPWIHFTTKNVKANDTVQNSSNSIESTEESVDLVGVYSNDTFYNSYLSPPVQVDAVPISNSTINVTWSPAKIDLENEKVAFYMVCYKEVNSMKYCEEGSNFFKSYINELTITGLKPFSLYEFQVRTHSTNEKYGPFSHLVECRTLEGVPSKVQELAFKFIGGSKVEITWDRPVNLNGILKNYNIRYTSRSSLPIDQWSSVTVLPTQNSYSLPEFKTEDNYMVHVSAVNKAGSSQPATLLVPNVKRPIKPSLHPPDQPEEDEPNQTFGILVGVLIASICIICCIMHFLLRRRCAKIFRGGEQRRSPDYRSGVHSTNGHSANTTHSSEPVVTMHALRNPMGQRRSDTGSTCSMTVGEDGEAHEMQCLMMGNELISLPPHIPPAVGTHPDTKGGATYPNGHINGFKYPLMSNGRIANGIVRITENPQYEPVTYDRSDNTHSNNNRLGDSIQDESRLSDDSKRSALDMTIDSSIFDTTQLTSLDSSIGPTSPRHISPILDPNG